MNQQLLANRQSGQNAQLQAGTTLSTSAAENQNRYNIAQGGNQTTLEAARMRDVTDKEGNAISREKNTLEGRRFDIMDRVETTKQQKQDARDVKEDRRFKTQDQRAADTNRLAQAKLTGDDGAEAGLASTYDPATPPPANDAPQMDRAAFNAWTNKKTTNISTDFEKGEKAQRIFEKYFQNTHPSNQVALLQSLPQDLREQIAHIGNSRYGGK